MDPLCMKLWFNNQVTITLHQTQCIMKKRIEHLKVNCQFIQELGEKWKIYNPQELTKSKPE